MKRFVLAVTLLAGCTGLLRAAPSGFDAFTILQSDPELGGLSGIEMTDDGSKLTAISDRGVLWTANVQRRNGVIADIVDLTPTPIRKAAGRGTPDAEGLAISADGTRYVSFEGRHSVNVIAADGSTTELTRAKAFRALQSNSSLEALAIDAVGTLYTIPERSGRMTRPFPVYRLQNDRWNIAFTIPRRGPFLVVGADIGPDDRFYVLERHFTGFGFQSRVRRFELDGSEETAIIQSATGQHDNLEGISVWGPKDALRMTLVSDDNFRFFQRTELVEYDLPR